MRLPLQSHSWSKCKKKCNNQGYSSLKVLEPIIHILFRCSLCQILGDTVSEECGRIFNEPYVGNTFLPTLLYSPETFCCWDSSFYSGKEFSFASKVPAHNMHLLEKVTTVPLHGLLSAKSRQDLAHQNNLPTEPFLSSLCSAFLFSSLCCKTLISIHNSDPQNK